MIWAVQDSLTWAALERNVRPLFDILNKLNRKIVNVGYVPDVKSITGIQDLDINVPVIFYGSTSLASLASVLSFKPGSFYDNNWWNPVLWKQHRNDMLNQIVYDRTIGDLRSNWITEESFIKPKGAKEFAGQVIEVDEQSGWCAEYELVLTDDIEICCSPVQKIEREWRFFIVDGQVITGSQYRKWGCVLTKELVSAEIYKIAQQFANGWLPNKTIVMDICELRDGSFKIVEFNSINSSGFYNCDIEKIVNAIEVKYG